MTGWQQLGAPALLIAALYREMLEVKAEVVICGQSTTLDQAACLRGGGRPGDVATPTHWNVVVSLVLHSLVPSWMSRGFGFRFGEAVLLILCWADDFTLIASSVTQLRTMLTEFAHAMYVHGIQLKQSKCKWLANTAAQEQAGVESPTMAIRIDAQLGIKTGQISPVSHVDVIFSRASRLEVLGACLTSQANAEDAIDFALSRGHGHWIMRRRQLCRRRVRLTLRVRRYYATVGLTVLHGLDGVPLTQALLRKVLSFDRRNLKSMLSMRKHSEETWVDYRRRQNRCLRRFMDRAGIMELVARLVGKQHGWAGHLMRLPPHHVVHSWGRTGTLEDWHLKQAIWSQCDPGNRTLWRHGRKGYQTHWEANLAACFGDLWRTRADDRKMWRASRTSYILQTLSRLLGENAKPMGLKPISEVNLSGGGDGDAAPVLHCDYVKCDGGSICSEVVSSETAVEMIGLLSGKANLQHQPASVANWVAGSSSQSAVDRIGLLSGKANLQHQPVSVTNWVAGSSSHSAVDGVDGICVMRTGATSATPPLVDNGAFGSIFVERRVAGLALRHFRQGLQLLFVGDSDILINALLGDAATKMPEIRRPVALAHAGLQTLIQSYGVRSPSGYDFAKQVPRSDNSAADAAANMALDHGSFMEVNLSEAVCFLAELSATSEQNIGMLFSFDGAARGNPGKSSYGVCGWWGFFKSGSFIPKGFLVKRGCRIGTNTNNCAEAQGLASAVKVCLQYYSWVIEQITQLAQYTVRDE